jgi:hypothetical protein
MTRAERLREREERGRRIREHAHALMEERAREKDIQQRRAAIRVVGGTDYEMRTA